MSKSPMMPMKKGGASGLVARPAITSHGRLSHLRQALSLIPRSQATEAWRRRFIIEMWTKLTKQGFSYQARETLLGVNRRTIWRWKTRGFQPRFYKCGRKSLFTLFSITPEVLARVSELHQPGISKSEAWRAYANEPNCDPLLSAFLKTSPRIPNSFLQSLTNNKSMNNEPNIARGGFRNPIDPPTAAARGKSAGHQAQGRQVDQANQFLAKARAYGVEHKLTGDADAVTAFARTPEGQALYQEYRKSIVGC